MCMTKDGDVCANSTPCDLCSKTTTSIVGSSARCDEHATSKEAAVTTSLKSFTEPLEEE